MRWDRFFEDLEDQLDSEWEAERAALDTEAERLRLSRVGLRERLVALASDGRAVGVEVTDGQSLRGVLSRVGADWCALAADGSGAGPVVVPLWAIASLAVPGDGLLASARAADGGSELSRRMGFGFVLRDLVRRRIPATVRTADGRQLAGTIDRAGSDHLDIALHEAGAPRRADNVTGYRIVPFAAVLTVRPEAATDLA